MSLGFFVLHNSKGVIKIIKITIIEGLVYNENNLNKKQVK